MRQRVSEFSKAWDIIAPGDTDMEVRRFLLEKTARVKAWEEAVETERERGRK